MALMVQRIHAPRSVVGAAGRSVADDALQKLSVGKVKGKSVNVRQLDEKMQAS
jgi:hypothetical protein